MLINQFYTTNLYNLANIKKMAGHKNISNGEFLYVCLYVDEDTLSKLKYPDVWKSRENLQPNILKSETQLNLSRPSLKFRNVQPQPWKLYMP